MTTILITTFILNAALLAVYVFRQRPSWTDDDHYALVEKYSETASALTAMKAELDKMQEQLEFSEDVRYTLGTGNAKMAQRIEELERDASRGEDVRGVLVDGLDKEIDMRLAFGKRLTEVQRSLRIARHKEFKRWKKLVVKRHKQGDIWDDKFTHGEWFDRCCFYRSYGKTGIYKYYANHGISFSRDLDPYPIP